MQVRMIPSNPCGFNDHHCNVAPAQALVLRLKKLKEGVRINNPTPSLSFYALSRYCDDKIRSILQNHPFVHRIQNYKKIFA